MDSLSDWISKKIMDFEKIDETAQCLELICEHPQFVFATFQFIYSHPTKYVTPFVKTTYPMEWVNHYLQHNFMDSDPIVRHSINTDNPFLWSEIKLTSIEDMMMKQAISFGLSPIGYSIPTVDVGPYRGLFSINAPSSTNKAWEKSIIQHEVLWKKFAIIIHRIARKEIDPNHEYIHNLSKRELECLHLINDGKTYGEIAKILEISKHTVRDYLHSLRLKLNCSTLAQAVGKAKHLRII